MKLKVSSEIENRIGIKNSRGKTNERNITLLCAVCRLDDVVKPPRLEVELSSGEALETATWPGISSRRLRQSQRG
jgi:hypothetical protein